MIHLKFLGEPAPQGSKTVTRYGGLREVSTKIHPWRASVQYACDEQYKGEPITEPVAMDVTFLLPRPKGDFSTAKGKEHEVKPSAPVHHTKTPDVDKLLRGLLDPMTVKCGGNVLMDDALVVEIQVKKRYASASQAKVLEHWCPYASCARTLAIRPTPGGHGRLATARACSEAVVCFQ